MPSPVPSAVTPRLLIPGRLLAVAVIALAVSCLTMTQAAEKKKPRPPETKAAPAAPATGVSPVSVEMLRGLSWRAIGPANMGGRISEIALVPGKAAQFFVGTGTGGLFKTGNDGTTFAPVFDDQPVVSMGSVAVAPSDPKIVYVGTGEGNGRNSSTWGNGVYRSTDGGDSFTHVGLDDSRDLPRLAIHPKNPDIVYAAAMGHLWDANRMRGLFKTTDGGKNWQPALQIDENTGCIDVLLDPANPDVVYAAMYARRRQPWSFQSGGFGDKGGIYKSTDAGKSFRRLTEGLPQKSGRIGLALFPSAATHLYAVIESDEAGTVGIDQWLSKAGGVFKSVDGGEHWTRLNALTPRSFYFSKIVVDPKDESRLYVLGFGLAISDDGGATFRANGAPLPHGDMHTLVVDPADTDHLLMGTDGGVYESRDRARTWRYLDNLATGEFYEIGLGMDSPYTVCGGLQDNGSWCGPSRGRFVFGEGDGHDDDKTMNLSSQDWFTVWGGDGYYVQIDPRNPKIIYAESQEGYIGRVDLDSGRLR
ncbi:MAG TPA: glycosyl hydrolase, partial [Candidatus Polarisedimenticolia bacterium]|nr:glycosyl hydrolase [Candidatus Polarisedimenticolia bacterium]